MTKNLKLALRPTIAAVALAVSGVYAIAAFGADVKVTLSGDQETPAVKTTAAGSGTIMVGDDKSVSGSVTTTGIAATMAHIHTAPGGCAGKVIIPLEKSGDNGWKVPAGAKLTDEQMTTFKAGGLYVNVHSAANKGGEICGQLKP